MSWAFIFCLTANILITGLYWSFIFSLGKTLQYENYNFHTAPMIASGFDFIFNLIVVELNLVIWSIIIGLLYGLVNCIWTLYILGEPVYPFVTWDKWWFVPVMIFGVTIVITILHTILWLITWLKLWAIF